MKSGNFNFLEPSGPLQACNGTDLPLHMVATVVYMVNPLAPELFFLISALSVYKMWIIQESNKLVLWNKLHFEGKNGEYRACLKYSAPMFVE